MKRGNVTVRFILQPLGEVDDIKVVKSSSFASLDAAALLTMHQTSPISLAHNYLDSPQVFTIKIHFD